MISATLFLAALALGQSAPAQFPAPPPAGGFAAPQTPTVPDKSPPLVGMPRVPDKSPPQTFGTPQQPHYGSPQQTYGSQQQAYNENYSANYQANYGTGAACPPCSTNMGANYNASANYNYGAQQQQAPRGPLSGIVSKITARGKNKIKNSHNVPGNIEITGRRNHIRNSDFAPQQ